MRLALVYADHREGKGARVEVTYAYIVRPKYVFSSFIISRLFSFF